jgi:hypothetical protein
MLNFIIGMVCIQKKTVYESSKLSTMSSILLGPWSIFPGDKVGLLYDLVKFKLDDLDCKKSEEDRVAPEHFTVGQIG